MANQDFGGRLNGVICDVVNCKFHGKDNFCHADAINVASSEAVRMGETFCSTFSVKSSM